MTACLMFQLSLTALDNPYLQAIQVLSMAAARRAAHTYAGRLAATTAPPTACPPCSCAQAESEATASTSSETPAPSAPS